MSPRRHHRLTAIAALLFTGAAVMTAAPTTSAAPQKPAFDGTQDFGFTGAPVDWTVPVGVHSIVATVCGASGENMMLAGSQVIFAGRPGHGGCVTATVAVTPGALIRVRVGGPGSAAAGGWPDGGQRLCPDIACGGTGGGSSDIRIGGDGLANRVLVGGGGGGGGGSSLGGTGGDGGDGVDGFNGGDGYTGGGLPENPNHPRGGFGGTLAQETKGCGVAISGSVPQCVTGFGVGWAYPPGRAGTANHGGEAAGVVLNGAEGGAGGGGWFGGGSGCSWDSNQDPKDANLGTCGGGGGSSYADPALTTDHSLFRGTGNWYDVWLSGHDTNGDPGTVSISWPGPTLPTPTPTPTPDDSASGGIPATGSTPHGLPVAFTAVAIGLGLVTLARRRTA